MHKLNFLSLQELRTNVLWILSEEVCNYYVCFTCFFIYGMLLVFKMQLSSVTDVFFATNKTNTYDNMNAYSFQPLRFVFKLFCSQPGEKHEIISFPSAKDKLVSPTHVGSGAVSLPP